MASPTRNAPSLTFPHAVWMRVRPRTRAELLSISRNPPVWVIQAVYRSHGGPITTAEQWTVTPVTELLNVIVYPPPGATDVRAVWYYRGVRHLSGIVWRPVLLVGPEEHDPDAGKINPEEFPRIRFDQPRPTEA